MKNCDGSGGKSPCRTGEECVCHLKKASDSKFAAAFFDHGGVMSSDAKTLRLMRAVRSALMTEVHAVDPAELKQNPHLKKLVRLIDRLDEQIEELTPEPEMREDHHDLSRLGEAEPYDPAIHDPEEM